VVLEYSVLSATQDGQSIGLVDYGGGTRYELAEFTIACRYVEIRKDGWVMGVMVFRPCFKQSGCWDEQTMRSARVQVGGSRI
jgi:hypothetical protein